MLSLIALIASFVSSISAFIGAFLMRISNRDGLLRLSLVFGHSKFFVIISGNPAQSVIHTLFSTPRIRCAPFGRAAVVIGQKGDRACTVKETAYYVVHINLCCARRVECGFPGRSAATYLHWPTDGVDSWARCPAHERCIWKPGCSGGSCSLRKMCHRSLRARVPLHSSNSIVFWN